MMTANEIRKQFLEFFASNGHKVVASDSVVPKEDPTVLFTTAGMQQFKRQFLGNIDDYTRAASSQKCIRTDDLDQVGETAFHHTFFEMLGNFSFGDYFKKEAIAWAWEFLTKNMGIPEEKLWVSIYKEDTEAEKIWLEDMGFPKNKLVKLDDHSNFWPADAKEKGPNGPCGPCSEIFYDYGINPNCPKKDKCNPSCDCGRFSEVWNLVFTQFDRKDGGVLAPLPAKNIDTGMGLERLAAVVQGKKSNFETDLFTPILDAINQEVKKSMISLSKKEKLLIADHIRAMVFAIGDGVIPSNKERGFVVKRLITDVTDIVLQHKGSPFAHKLVPVVVDIMKDPYPELIKRMNEITLYIKKTEEDYRKVYKTRIPELMREIEDALVMNPKELDRTLGKIAFNYRDTYGLTLPTIVMTMKECGVQNNIMDSAKKYFQDYMEEQQERSRAASKMTGDVFTNTTLVLDLPKTEFLGNDLLKSEGKLLKIFISNNEVKEISKGDEAKLILDKTTFYAESGGQIGDTGFIVGNKGTFRVSNTQKVDDVYIHIGCVEQGSFVPNDFIKTEVDEERRLSIMRNHTATHLLQSALRHVLGEHVKQQGSLVSDDRLRFDFSHPQGLTEAQIQSIEESVNRSVMQCTPVIKKDMSIHDAKKNGALAFFAEKYGEKVRVVSIDEYSRELCGGTHLSSTGQIGLFKITSESAIAQGIRRIEAVTGFGALQFIGQKEKTLKDIAKLLKASPGEILSKINLQTARLKRLEKEAEHYHFESIKKTLDKIIAEAESINKAKILTHVFEDIEIQTLRKISDLLRQKMPSSVIVLGSTFDGNAYILTSVTDNLIKDNNLKANEIINRISPIINGSGGGRPQLAQAGSKNVSKLKEALSKAKEFIKERMCP